MSSLKTVEAEEIMKLLGIGGWTWQGLDWGKEGGKM